MGNDNPKALLDKLQRTIETSEEKHKDVLVRYVNLVRRRLSAITKPDTLLKKYVYRRLVKLAYLWSSKFGRFRGWF